jgi:hypothetical protein
VGDVARVAVGILYQHDGAGGCFIPSLACHGGLYGLWLSMLATVCPHDNGDWVCQAHEIDRLVRVGLVKR